MTQFVCTSGKYETYRGYVFAFNKPTTISDRATIEALRSQPRKFKEIRHEEKQVEAPAEKVLNPDACPKCGRVIKRGMTMHRKFCKGPK